LARQWSIVVALVAGLGSATAEAAPAGCDAARPAVEHAPGADRAAPPAGTRLIPCRHDTGARSMEPSFGFTRGGRVLFQGWELRPGATNGAPPVPVVRRSSANLATWEDVSPLGPATSLDPYLDVDPRTGRVFSVNYLGGGQCSSVSFSDDAGDRWTHSPLAACAGFDGQSITTGPPVTSRPVGYPNLVYYCTGNTPGSATPGTTPFCSKSLDGGVTFVPTGEPPFPLADPDAQEDEFGPWAGNPVVTPDGTLFIAKRYRGQPEVSISTNEGLSWQRVQVATNGSSGETPRMALNARGDLFYAWAGADHRPYLSTSRDRGRSWSTPLALAPPGLREAALPWPAVSGTGRVLVAYLGSTDATGMPPFYAYCNYLLSPCEEANYANVSWNGYMTVVDDAFAARPKLQTATVNPPGRPLFIGGCSADGACKANLDFIDADFSPSGEPWAAFVDDCKLERDFVSVFGEGFGKCSDNLGEGILGRLVLVEETGSAADLGLPPARTCASRRNFQIRLRAPRGVRLRSATVFVGGRRARVLRGSRLRAVVDLRGLPRGVVTVRIVARTVRGGRIERVRRYRTCVPRR
jgi:hypothetical protein